MNAMTRPAGVAVLAAAAVLSSGCSYNRFVSQYNTLRRQFPSNITAGLFGFEEYPVFNAPPEAERVPRVDFGRQPS
ncbi:MAG: LemA family protein [Acidobacteria bacterium]|nr:LemA family protein [Acidobacteriota bacterium]